MLAEYRMLAKELAAITSICPGLVLGSRAVLEAVMLVEGPVGSAANLARILGMRNRYALYRLWKREGLPPLRRFSSWALILSWVRAAELHNASLCRLACQSHRHPSACYRLVKQITGHPWKELLARGSRWVELELLKEFRLSREHLAAVAHRVPSSPSPL